MNLSKRLWKMPIKLKVVCKYEGDRFGLDTSHSKSHFAWQWFSEIGTI